MDKSGLVVSFAICRSFEWPDRLSPNRLASLHRGHRAVHRGQNNETRGRDTKPVYPADEETPKSSRAYACAVKTLQAEAYSLCSVE
jgi:hypothetical protein